MRPTNICFCCNRTFEQHLMLECSVCKKFFKNTCVDISASEVRIINANKGYEWTCKNCREFGNDLKELKVLIIALREEIQSLRNENSKIVGNLNNNLNFEEVIGEINDRNSRKSNVVIFGVEEQEQNLLGSSAKEKDKNEVQGIVNSICPNNDIQAIDVFRIGKYDNTKTRPIKVTCTDEKQVHLIISNAKKLRNMREYRNISISYDRTKRQIEYYKSLKKELEERQKNGEANSRIKYYNGVPRIVSTLN